MRSHFSGPFCVSMNPNASQLVLMAHGGYFGSDSAAIPNGTRIVHFYTFHGEYGKRAAVDAVFAAGAMNARQGLTDMIRMIQARSVRNAPGESTTIKNYELGALEGADDIWNNHQARRTSPLLPSWDGDIDLMVLKGGGESTIRKAFEVARQAHGQDYEIFHACHCRYTQN